MTYFFEMRCGLALVMLPGFKNFHSAALKQSRRPASIRLCHSLPSGKMSSFEMQRELGLGIAIKFHQVSSNRVVQ
jgi:hypothetical protein